MEKPECDQKWEAKVCTRLTIATADQIWPLVKDFFNMHKYFPNLTICCGIHGNNGEPGCIRYCAGSSIPSTAGESTVSWSTERVLAVDHVEKSLTYEILDCNVGFKSYVSTMKIRPGDGDGGKGCVMEWFIAVDPVEGWSFEDLVRKYEAALQCMAKRMEDAIVSPEKVNKIYIFIIQVAIVSLHRNLKSFGARSVTVVNNKYP